MTEAPPQLPPLQTQQPLQQTLGRRQLAPTMSRRSTKGVGNWGPCVPFITPVEPPSQHPSAVPVPCQCMFSETKNVESC